MKRAHASENCSRGNSPSNLAAEDSGAHTRSHDTSLMRMGGPQISRLPIAGTFSKSQAKTFLQRSLAGTGLALARPSSDPSSSHIGVQAKLKIGQPGDKYEQEADRVADQVMHTPEPRIQRQATNEEEEEGGPTCVSCFPQSKPLEGQAIVQRQAEEEEEEPEVSAKPLDGATVQRQADEEEETEEEEEEPEVSAKPLEVGTVQRQAEEEEEEPEVSAKLMEGAPTLQRQAEDEEGMAKLADGAVVQRQEKEEETTKCGPSGPCMRSPTNGGGRVPRSNSNMTASVGALKGGGTPLSEAERSFFEPRFGHDFSRVRVHTGSQAAGLARSMNARAFTRATDIVFGSGQHASGTEHGRKLLAHELTHVVQQGAGRKRSPETAPTVRKGAGSKPASGQVQSPDLDRSRIERKPVRPKLSRVFRNAPIGASRANVRLARPDPGAGIQARPKMGHPGEQSSVETGVETSEPRIQRQVQENVVLKTKPNAEACLVHLHGDEKNAKKVAEHLQKTHCVNLVHIQSSKRNLTIKVPYATGKGKGTGKVTVKFATCVADPNRIFDDSLLLNAKGKKKFGDWQKRNKGKCLRKSIRDKGQKMVVKWRKDILEPKIRRCRVGSASKLKPGATGLTGKLPVAAFHNNVPGPSLHIKAYKPGGCQAKAADPKDPRIGQEWIHRKRQPPKCPRNPHIAGGQRKDNFFLVTQVSDFFKFVYMGRNVVLQKTKPPQDGSLSVVLGPGQRYINVEALHKGRNKSREKKDNEKMGLAALKVLIKHKVCRTP